MPFGIKKQQELRKRTDHSPGHQSSLMALLDPECAIRLKEDLELKEKPLTAVFATEIPSNSPQNGGVMHKEKPRRATN